MGNPGTHLFCMAGGAECRTVRIFSGSTNQSGMMQYLGPDDERFDAARVKAKREGLR